MRQLLYYQSLILSAFASLFENKSSFRLLHYDLNLLLPVSLGWYKANYLRSAEKCEVKERKKHIQKQLLQAFL